MAERKTIKVFSTINDPDPVIIYHVTGYNVNDDGVLLIKSGAALHFFNGFAWARYDVLDNENTSNT